MSAHTDSVAVRAARAMDLPGIQRVANQTWPATYSGSIPDADIAAFLETNYSVERLTRIRDRMGAGLLVAAHEETVVGYSMLSKNQEGSAELWAIYVLPGWQRHGVGRLLWDRACEIGLTLEADEMVLWVLDSNSNARRFYESQGARVDGERDFPVGEGSVREARYCLKLA